MIKSNIEKNKKNSLNPKSKKLLRVISKTGKINENAKYTDTFSSFNEDFSAKLTKNLYLQIYDIESDLLYEHKLNFSQLNLEGMSQIFLDNKLFLCGCKLNSINKEKDTLDTNPNSFSSSFMYSIDITKEPITVSFEVNSCYMHYYPSLSILRNEYIIVIAGFKSHKCEYYSITNKRWKDIPDLPEERYGCSLFCDNSYNYVYCFGGYNSLTQKCCSTIFRLNMNKANKWDTILVMENSEFLTKKFSCVGKINESSFVILGGKDNYNYTSDDIINIEIINKNNKIIINENKGKKLANKSEFISIREGLFYEDSLYCFDDEIKDIIHKVEKKVATTIKLTSI